MLMSAIKLPAYSAAAASIPTSPLRVGAIVDSLEVPVWVKHILEQIDGSECLEFTLLACNGESVRRSAWDNLQNQHISPLFRAWAWLDYWMFRTRIDKPNAVEIGHFTPEHATPQVLHRSWQERSFGAR